MKKALLVIDMQNVCVGEKHATYFKYDNENLIQAVNKVIDENRDNPVIYIKNIMKKNLINKLAPFQVSIPAPIESPVRSLGATLPTA